MLSDVRKYLASFSLKFKKMGGYRQTPAEENDSEYLPVIECEQKLILRDFAGALSAATQHVQSPALGLFATRERALAVAVQALHELGRGEEAFDLVLSTVAGPGGGYAEVADVNPGLLKLLFRLRMHLDGTPEKAQKILMPYIVRLCRRKDSFQRWSHRHAGVSEEDEVDVEVVELFLLDCVLAVEVRADSSCEQSNECSEPYVFNPCLSAL